MLGVCWCYGIRNLIDVSTSSPFRGADRAFAALLDIDPIAIEPTPAGLDSAGGKAR
jgi:hypothetical protein